MEATDGISEHKTDLAVGAIGDWAETASDDFAIANVFSGGRLVRYFSAYENSSIYLERMTTKGRESQRFLYFI